MSHEATAWAFKVRGLKPGAKMVLWALADRHNPDYGCFPSQERLAADCEVDPRTVRTHLKTLERAQLIHRVKRPKTLSGLHRSDRYILAFEPDFPKPSAPINDSTKRKKHPLDGSFQNHRKKGPPNLVREPVRSARARAHTKAADPASFWASKINAKEFIPMTAVSLPLAREMVERGFVTPEALKEAGVAI